jgi:outer membrane protein TolC
LRVLLSGAGLALAARTPAQEPLRLTVSGAVARALSEGAAAAIATERVVESRAAAGLARSGLLPQVTGEVQQANESLNLATFGLSIPGQNPIVGPFNVFDAHVRVAARLIDLAAYRRYQAARQGIVVADVDRQRIDNEVAAAVATLYVALQRAEASIDAGRANVDLFTKLRDLADDQRRSGLGTRLDTTRAEVALARQRQALLVAENARETARLSLLHAIGADLSQPVMLTDRLAEDTAAPAPVEERLATARRLRPELRAIEEQLRQAELSVSAERAERVPSLAAQFQGGYNGNRLSDLAYTRSIAALLTVPVFNGGRFESAIAEAESRRRQLRIERVETDRQVEEDVRRALANYDNARNRAAVAAENVRLAGDELTFARDRFVNGISSSVEVDNAQTSYVAAQDDRIAALADEARARFDLLRATGEIRDLAAAPVPESR